MINLQTNKARLQIQSPRFSSERLCIRICTALITFFFSIALPATVLGTKIQSPELTINVGVRDDAKPFSYVDTTHNSETILPGYSGYSVEVCRHVLTQMKTLPQYQNYTFTAVKTKAATRFKHLGADGKLFMLCGPDSISADRLVDYRSSYAVFLTGMTYAYVNPRSPKFPRGNYCENVVGVVRGTTADTEGLKDLASRNLLMRFDQALDLEVHKKSGRVEKSRQALRKTTEDVLEDAQKEIAKLIEQIRRAKLEALTTKTEVKANANASIRLRQLIIQSQKINDIVSNTDLVNWDNALTELEIDGIGMAAKINDLMPGMYQKINAQIAQEIITDECPQGFTSMPVRKFEDHEKGIAAFCKGEVLYYLADYDILKSKTQEISGCDIVMNPFARSREVYGVYFPKQDYFDTNPESHSEPRIDVASFFVDFNDILLDAMQDKRSVLENIFEQEFDTQQKSEELERFFDSLKFYTP